MNDKRKIVLGLVIAMFVLTFPFWYTLASGRPDPRPELEMPEGGGSCVRDAGYMRAHHMDLLDQWRNEVVRKGDATPVKINGKEYPKSLTRGCMSCHTNRQNFCTRCHNYVDVRPTCWDCHIEPEELVPETLNDG